MFINIQRKVPVVAFHTGLSDTVLPVTYEYILTQKRNIRFKRFCIFWSKVVSKKKKKKKKKFPERLAHMKMQPF